MSYILYNRQHRRKKSQILHTLQVIGAHLLRSIIRGLKKLTKAFGKLTYRMKLGVILASFLIIASLIALVVNLANQNKSKLFFRSTYQNGVFTYEGENKDADLTTDIHTTVTGASISVARQGTSLEMLVPLESASMRTSKRDTVDITSKDKNAHIEYSLTPTGVKENIVLKTRPTTNTFTTVLNTTNLVMNKSVDGVPVFTDTKGMYQFHFERPFSIDAAGNKTYSVSYKISPTKDIPTEAVLGATTAHHGLYTRKPLFGMTGDHFTGSTYTVIATVDPEWLRDPKRVFPINIDPTITHNSSSTFANGQLNRVFDFGSGSTPNLMTYYQEVSADSNTTALYHFNTGACTTDSSGNGFTLTANGGMTCSSGGLFGFKASGFTTAPISYSNTTVMNSASTNGTIEAWINPVNLTGTQTILYADSASDTLLTIGSSGQVNFSTSGSTNLATANTLVPIATWTHVAAVWTAAGHKIYINGAEVATDTNTTTHTAQSYTTYIGVGASGNTNAFSGSIDEVRISSVARTPEELKADAQRRPYGVYTSPAIDMTSSSSVVVNSWSNLSWIPGGSETGDGEIASNSSGLVSQWGFNSTSGTTATNDAASNSCGGTAANCNMTLNNFTSTAGQDPTFSCCSNPSGWTANNRRWGAGALMFYSGANDYLSLANPASNVLDPGTGSFTIEGWIKTTALGQDTIIQNNTTVGACAANAGYTLVVNSSGFLVAYASDGSTCYVNAQTSVRKVTDGQWHYFSWVVNRTVSSALYIDGSLDISTAISNVVAANPTATIYIGGVAGTGDSDFTLDVLRYYLRPISAPEVVSNYNASNLEFETRVGATSTPDDGTWEAWKPTTSESQIDSEDGTTATPGVYASTYDFNQTNTSTNQIWQKYDNTAGSATNSASTNGRIPLGVPGSGDSVRTIAASVIKDASTYKMWYAGHDGTNYRIFYATSPDGLTWTKLDNSIPSNSDSTSTNGRIPLGGTGKGDSQGANTPNVIKDGNTYKMWYSGFDGTNYRIFYATSPDGLTWTKYDNSSAASSNAIGTNGRVPLGTTGGDTTYTYRPSVIKDGNTYKMWYSGYDGSAWRIFYATSPDGLTWTKLDNTILAASDTTGTNGRIPLGASGGDQSQVYAPTVLKDGNTYKMWYSGMDSSTFQWRGYYATSGDGLTWSKFDNTTPTASNTIGTNGKLPLGTTGTDTIYVVTPSVIKDGNTFKMWYSTEDNNNSRILYAQMVPFSTNKTTDSILKTEGTGSQKFSFGAFQTDPSTRGLWRLDETSGSSAYIKDSSTHGASVSVNTGTGNDGAVTVTGPRIITGQTIETGRPNCLSATPCADGIAYKVSSDPTGGSSIVTTDTPTGIAANDQLLLIDLQGSTTDSGAVGTYEFISVGSVNTGTKTITTSTPVSKSYTGSSFANQKVVVQRVPNYTSVTLSSSGIITAAPFDGLTQAPATGSGYQTGIVAFRANGTVSVASGTSITTTGLGYRGGAGGTAGAVGGISGETFDTQTLTVGSGTGRGGSGATLPTAGFGGGSGGDAAITSPASGNAFRGGGGGGGSSGSGASTGGGGGGAGGSYGSGGGGGGGSATTTSAAGGAVGIDAGGGGGAGTTTGGAGGSNFVGGNGTGTIGVGGATGGASINASGGGGDASSTAAGGGGGGGSLYGSPTLSTLFPGSGGGGGGGSTNTSTAGGAGGNGGGIIFIGASTLTVTTTGAISAQGLTGIGGTTNSGSGGSGAGGSILIQANTLTLGSNLVTAASVGAVAKVGKGGGGGAGGVGIIHIDVANANYSGTTTPTAIFNATYVGDLTPTASPTVVDGYYQRAMKFNGSTQYLSCTDANCGGTVGGLDPGTSSWSVGAWIKTTATAQQMIVTKGSVTTQLSYALETGVAGTGLPTFILFNTGDTGYKTATGGTAVSDGKWHYLLGTYDGTNITLYVDGAQATTNSAVSGTQVTDSTSEFDIGSKGGSTLWFNGTIDEVMVEARTFTAEEAMELYRGLRDYRFSKVISSTDLTGKTKVPFSFASDRRGEFLEATIGESATLTNDSDSNTVGLYHLEEQTGSGAYLKDSSGFGNNGTPTGTSFDIGKIGRARTFAATDFITTPEIGYNPSAKTIEMWVRPTWNGTDSVLHGLWQNNNTTGNGSPNYAQLFKYSDNNLYFRVNNPSGTNTDCIVPATTNQFTAGVWVYVAASYDSTGSHVYFNGNSMCTGTAMTAPTANPDTNGRIGYSFGAALGGGTIDEVRVSNTVRTPDEIRQTFEIGKRTHPIVVDFKAKLDAGNLITGSGDTGFTVDGTAYGSTNKGDNLYLGDKVVVEENVGGTYYYAQGNVNAITASTGAVTVTSWDAGSTFPGSGFTASAVVFKWQTEWFDPTGSLTSQRNGITQITLRDVDGSMGENVWLDDLRNVGPYLATAGGSPVPSSTGNRYFQYRALFSSWDTTDTASLSAVTVDYNQNSVPATPSLDLPSNAATNQSLTPVLKTTASDADSDYLRYKIQLCTDAGMSVACQTFDQTSSQTGWSGQNTQSSTAYTSGTQSVYTVQTPLAGNTTYYWKSVAIDPGGTNSFSATQGSPFSFTTSAIPGVPSLDLPTNAATNQLLSPVLKTTSTDSNSDYLRYKIQLCTDAGMSVACQTFDQTSSQTGWSGQNAQTSTAYNSGIQATYTIQTPLNPGITYYWRSYAIDPGGSNTFSTTQGSPFSFTTAANPTAPTALLTNGSTNPTGLAPASTPFFSAVFNDPNGAATTVLYQIQVSTDSTMGNVTNWDSGFTSMSSTAQGARSPNINYAGTALVSNATYYWRIRFVNNTGATGAYSSIASFSTTQLFAANCSLQKNNANTQIIVKWSNTNTINDGYTIERNVDNAGFSALTTTGPSGTSATDGTVTSGHTYQYRVKATLGGQSSDFCTSATLSLQTGTFGFY